MDRNNEHSLYNTRNVFLQYGGSDSSKSSKSSKSFNSSDIKTSSKKYTPSDMDDETATAVDKFRKANRLLQKELEDTKKALDKEIRENAKLKKQLEIKQFQG